MRPVRQTDRYPGSALTCTMHDWYDEWQKACSSIDRLLWRADSGMWQNVSIGGFVFVGAMCAYEYKVHMDHVNSGHHYDREANKYPYMGFRLKQFPWGCADCNLFDAKWCVPLPQLFSSGCLMPCVDAAGGRFFITRFFSSAIRTMVAERDVLKELNETCRREVLNEMCFTEVLNEMCFTEVLNEKAFNASVFGTRSQKENC
eukprot:1998315-Rhodomonas_salina.2